jgi:hypothetical protein
MCFALNQLLEMTNKAMTLFMCLFRAGLLAAGLGLGCILDVRYGIYFHY